MRPHEPTYDVTVVISTYNRCALLPAALRSVTAQQLDGATCELVVVDNNSTDATRSVIESFIAQQGGGEIPVRYLFEPKQGLSHGWNTGIEHARGRIIAFTDDDIEVAGDWVSQIKRAFDCHPEIDFIGGNVLPVWKAEVPSWLTRDHWSPLAIHERAKPYYANAAYPVCLLGKSFRREAFELVGNFKPELGRIKDHIGSLEDADLQMRLYRAGRQGMFVPSVVMHSEVAPERMTKAYHRRWHTGHGYHYALMRDPEIEFETSKRRLFDVPAFQYRQAGENLVKLIGNLLRGRSDEAFVYETKLRFFLGYFRTRRADYMTTYKGGALAEVIRFARALAGKRDARETDGATPQTSGAHVEQARERLFP